jgi:hypothetical protein
MGVVKDFYELAIEESAFFNLKARAEAVGATVRDLIEGVMGILGADPVLLDNVIDGDPLAPNT